MFRTLIVGIVAFLFLAAPAQAQTVTPASNLAWDQSAPDLASAQGYSYRSYADGAAVGSVLAGVTCTGTAPIVCVVAFPAFTPGAHTLQLSASNLAGESVKSASLAFVLVVVPSAPTGLRIQ